MTSRTDRQENLTSNLTFGGHLEVLRKMLFRILSVTVMLGGVVFYFKNETFSILLAPHNPDFVTFRWIEKLSQATGFTFDFGQQIIPLINTDLAAQFMTHISVSCMLAVLLASPYILVELFRFISPALYRQEKRYFAAFACAVFCLFFTGLLMSYFVVFPISFKFLATYQVDSEITNTITLDSYISTFTSITFLLGIVFQTPVLALLLCRMGLVNAGMLRKYRPYAIVSIMVIAAVITPPDIFTLIIATIPIYLLYETSIMILDRYSE